VIDMSLLLNMAQASLNTLLQESTEEVVAVAMVLAMVVVVVVVVVVLHLYLVFRTCL
jgi:hypothetical protein